MKQVRLIHEGLADVVRYYPYGIEDAACAEAAVRVLLNESEHYRRLAGPAQPPQPQP